MSRLLISGIKPTSTPHLGNYIGALAQWRTLQHDYRCRFFVADLHAITVPQDPTLLRARSLEVVAVYLAIGIDPRLVSFFLQSEVPEHAELSWILCTIARMGEMRRMTQYKDVSQKNGEEQSGVGLFSYPILMAADILLYDAEVVPVGEDQVQHLELARDLAHRFNERFGDTFRLPQPVMQTHGARIMSLADETKKMSKSDPSIYGSIFLTDTDDAIQKKIQRAVTDTEGSVRFDAATKPAVSNLLTILHHMSGESIESIEARFAGQGYGAFKKALAEATIAHLSPIRARIQELLANPEEIHRVLDAGRDEARSVAQQKIREVKQRVGLGR
jgi:tryptophanyl-tRNA synthetase